MLNREVLWIIVQGFQLYHGNFFRFLPSSVLNRFVFLNTSLILLFLKSLLRIFAAMKTKNVSPGATWSLKLRSVSWNNRVPSKIWSSISAWTRICSIHVLISIVLTSGAKRVINIRVKTQKIQKKFFIHKSHVYNSIVQYCQQKVPISSIFCVSWVKTIQLWAVERSVVLKNLRFLRGKLGPVVMKSGSLKHRI